MIGNQAWRRWRRLIALTVIAAIASETLQSNAQTEQSVQVTAAGLTNPRGIAWDDDGNLYVAVAGNPEQGSGVVRIVAGCPQAVVSGLPAYRITFGGMTGVADVAFIDATGYLLLSGGDIDRGNTANGLYRFDEDGSTELVADVSSFIRDNPVADRPPDFDTDGQPYAMLPAGEAFWVTEGNSNQLLRIGMDGTVSRIADLSGGHPIPTGIAHAPGDGAYVAFFTSAPYLEGKSRIVETDQSGAIRDVWSGLTLVTALATAPDGTLYALEMATGINPDDPASIAPGSGRVVRMTGTQETEVVAVGLSFPVAMEFGADGALYVSSPAVGADAGEGTILRLDVSGGLPLDVSAAESAPSCP